MDDLWHVEVYYRQVGKPGERLVAVSKDDAIKRMDEALDDEKVGGVVAYRPPLQTGEMPERWEG